MGWRLWIHLRFRPGIFVQTPWGHLSLKRRSDMLFSERYGHTPVTLIGPLCFAWRQPSPNRGRENE